MTAPLPTSPADNQEAVEYRARCLNCTFMITGELDFVKVVARHGAKPFPIHTVVMEQSTVTRSEWTEVSL